MGKVSRTLGWMVLGLLVAASARAQAPSIALESMRRSGDGYQVQLDAEETAVLTLDAGLQQHVIERLERYDVPEGGVVAIEPRTGRLLAVVGRNRGRTEFDRAFEANAPAASVFKLITASALLDRGIRPDQRTCYHGGSGGLYSEHLEDSPLDTLCPTFADALGHSVNAVFAKLSDRRLNPSILQRYAAAFGFGQTLPVPFASVQRSGIDVPAGRLERARMAAGFRHSLLSPMHGALIAATIANGGRMPRASLVDRIIVDADGRTRARHQSVVHREVIGELTARALTEMMERTVTHGTARRAFFDEQGQPFLPGIRVAGKTGTLIDERPYRAYTWWVGFAPADDPQIAVAALVVNQPRWRIKASYMARETLRYWLRERD